MERFTVSELTHEISSLLGASFEDVEVEGEISGFKAHGSGHWYFTLKDDGAVLNCAMFRNWNARVRRPPREGDRILARGALDVYPPRGSYSLVVRQIVAAGEGDLARRLEELRVRLAAEGLFDPARKRPLPIYPSAVGVATSPTGAAFADIRRVIRQRYPGLPIFLAPCRVQGDGAAQEVANAIAMLNAHGKSDVIILGRGGGSAEDLWCFNEEVVVRAVANSRIPTVSAVGHEVDVSLSDFAADLRAATPSHAAEQVVPVRSDLLSLVSDRDDRLLHAVTRRLALARDRLTRVRVVHPRQRVERGQMRLDDLYDRLQTASQRLVVLRRQRSVQLARQLDALSPLAVLVRGYAIATHEGRAVRSAKELQPGDALEVRFGEGRVDAEVRKVR